MSSKPNHEEPAPSQPAAMPSKQTLPRRHSRKDDHVRLANAQHEAEGCNSFDDVRFVHNSFPDMAVHDVDMHVDMLGSQWDVPFYVNAMTGGSASTGVLNGALAQAAESCGVAIASGSQHAALRDRALTPTFTTLREHTHGFLFANVGPSVTASQARQAVDMIAANALQIHVNAAQEIVMPEGDRDFSDWKATIREILETVDVPVVVKEVGFGMSQATIRAIAAMGVAAIDVSGRGGTDFITIENQRRNRSEYGYMAGWGESTVLSLLNAVEVHHERLADRDGSSHASSDSVLQPQIVASGGVRTPLDVAIALSLGAQAVGVSGHFLHTLIKSGESGLVEEIERWKQQLRSIMTLLGARTIPELRTRNLLVTGQTGREAELLGISLKDYANRWVQSVD
ncbi:type 2 isopentenyl-diphosphate Delta-isomerase [Bifidobacterium sp.]|uniref:type 2 isopentenyl-diphosphate Delta-isomerase n=1 Tax=Bifidobacterium sp. TaxID=41200 RepID=UPI0039ED28AF